MMKLPSLAWLLNRNARLRLHSGLRVDERIDVGTYFECYRALDEQQKRPVCVKLARALDDPLDRQVIADHLALWQRLCGRAIVGLPVIHAIGDLGGRPYCVMEWLEAASLAAIMTGGEPPSSDLPIQVREQGARILSAMHACGLVHGDVTPSNILVETTGATVRLWLVDPAPTLSESGPTNPQHRLIIGTPRYLAPEILRGSPPTPATDFHALDLIVLELEAASRASAPAGNFWSDRTVVVPAAPAPATGKASGREPPRMLHRLRPKPQTEAPAVGSAPERAPALSSAPAPAPLPPNEAKPESFAPNAGDWAARSMALSVPVPPREAGAVASPADFSVIAPPLIDAGRHFVIELWVAPSGRHDALLSQAMRPGRMVERAHRAHLDIAKDQILTAILKLPDFEVEDAVEHLGWNDDIRNVAFMAKAPRELKPGTYPGVVKLLQQQTPFASIWFDLQIAADAPSAQEQTPLTTRVRRITRAFASYASEDRGEVLRRVQGIRAAGVEVFLDIVNLRTGQQWEDALYREIEAAHGFYLFWSHHAKASAWVEKEWRYALDRRGLDFINPLALEDPRLASPPAELSSKHFNDMMLAFIACEQIAQRGP